MKSGTYGRFPAAPVETEGCLSLFTSSEAENEAFQLVGCGVEGSAGLVVPLSLRVRSRLDAERGTRIFRGNFCATYRERNRPWNVIEMNATPRTIDETRSRSGSVPGSDAARTMDNAPRIPPSIATFCQDMGTFCWSMRLVPRSGYTLVSRAIVTARKPMPIGRRSLVMRARSVLRPI